MYDVYLLTNHYDTALYVGVTRDVLGRYLQHRDGVHEGFSKHYHLKKLVYDEEHERILDAIAREKRLKRRQRRWKIELIESINPTVWSEILFSSIPRQSCADAQTGFGWVGWGKGRSTQ